jgi:hypothetical protein
MSHGSLQYLRWAWLFAAHIVMFANGVRDYADPAREMSFFVIGIALGFSVLWACVIDSRLIQKPILPILQMLMLATWPVAAPAYLIWSRGLRGALWSMLWIATLLMMHHAGQLTAYGLLTANR